ncbi:MAG TPA: hypothetical protein VF183_12025 [Acidimicrobiales bacterium]
MPISPPRRAGTLALGSLVVLMLVTGCGDDDTPAITGTTAAPETTVGSTTSAAPTTTTVSLEQAALDLVRTFAEEEVGMVDPVVGPFAAADADGTATVEVRPRREGGAEDPSLPATVVTLREGSDGWEIESATGPLLRIDSPPPGQVLSAGFVTPSGVATAFEGTVVVSALVGSPSGWRELGQEVTTAEGIEDAPWSARVETGTEATGPGFVLATTTAGTESGPPAFALVPVRWGQP